jgi:hypothetical protein
MEEDHFNSLSKDDKKYVMDKWTDLLQGVIRQRMEILPLGSGVAAALLVIATFNKTLIDSDVIIKILISLLLLIIPVALFFYNRDLVVTQTKCISEIDKLTGEKNNPELGVLNKISAYLPDVLIYIILIVVIIFVSKIWNIGLSISLFIKK